MQYSFHGSCLKQEKVLTSELSEKILPLLDSEEASVYRRGRNAKVNSVPHNADIGQYHAATGLEALFGWLYLQGRTERAEEFFRAIMEAE